MNGQTSCDVNHKCDTRYSIEFIPNKNQTHPNVQFEVGIGGFDKVFLEDNAFTYVVYEDKAVQALHDVVQFRDKEAASNHPVAGHSYKVKFLNALKPTIKGNSRQAHHYNYFLGNKPSKWASKVPVFHQAKYESLYDGINLVAYSNHGYLKYDFVIEPNTDVNVLALEYEGVDDLRINRSGDLIIKTSVKEIVEKAPIAYQIINSERVYVDCKYRLENRTLKFDFPNGYDDEIQLVIDPEVIASTLTRTTNSRNFGHTASYDNAGNIYLGGVSFGVGYPTNSGSFQTSFGGGVTDMAVCKFNKDGSQMIYATYLGGVDKDSPHSIIIDDNQQLCILGSTQSPDFPVTSNAYQKTIGGKEDIAIIKLNQDGSALVGSTFIGGSNTDGINTSELNTNYGEKFRGEIILDQNGNVLIASNTTSSDFPITPNAFQSNLRVSGGNLTNNQDGVIFKFNSDLSTLFWSTYLGSDDPDTAFGIRINDEGEIYVTGTAGSENFPTTIGTIQNVWPGGQESAYVAVLSSNGQQLLRSTFWGTEADEHSYFLDIDELGNVHIYGQTTGVMPISPGAYFFNTGSPQFLAAFSSDLKSLVYSTVIGTGPPIDLPFPLPGLSIEYDFVPAAFMVDKCNGIYFSGYYANFGLPTTYDAIPGSSGDAFYLGVLEKDASALKFGTYFGNANHVDGGTSRFDKGGVVYQAVCSCKGHVLTTMPGSWAEEHTQHCDMGVFKIDFEISSVTAQTSFDQSASGCAPYTVDFQYTGQDGINYFWDFGNGSTSSDKNPSNTYLDPGSYTVMLVAENLNSCNLRDTSYSQIDVLGGKSSSIDTSICSGSGLLFLDASIHNATYIWQDGSTGATFEAVTPGVYWVDISIAGCSQRDTFNVTNMAIGGTLLEDDIRICGESNYLIEINNNAYSSFLWSDNSSESSLLASTDGIYSVTVTDPNGCELTDDISVDFIATPVVDLGSDLSICKGELTTLQSDITQGEFVWQDNSTDYQLITDTPGIYTLTVTVDGCTGQDEIEVFPTPELAIDLGPDKILCDQESFTLDGTTLGAIAYSWTGAHIDPIIEITSSGLYELSVTDGFGCEEKEEIRIDFVDSPDLSLQDTSFCEGQTVLLKTSAVADRYLWNNGENSSSITISESGEYWLEAEYQGCISKDTAKVTVVSIPMLNLGDDQVLCDNVSLILDATLSGGSYEWQDGSINSTFEVVDSGTYSVIVEVDGCFNTDFIEISPFVPLIIDLGEDKILCDISSFDLKVQNNFIQNYEWSTGEITSSITIDQDGMYWVQLEDMNGCFSRDSIELNFAESPKINLNDSTLCEGDQIELNAYSDGASYIWNDGSTDDSFSVYTSGEFWVEVNNKGCISRDTSKITIIPIPIIDLGADHILCVGDSMKLDVTLDGATYEWQDGSMNSTFEVLNPGMYSVSVELDGCSNTDFIEISPSVSLNFELGEDKLLCDILSFELGVEDNLIQSYEWSTGEVTANINPNEDGIYWVELLDKDGCIHQDSIELKFIESPILNLNDTTLCIGEEVEQNAFSQGASYLWSDGSTNEMLLINTAGEYWVEAEFQGCVSRDTAVINFASAPDYSVSQTEVSCFSSCNGSLDLMINSEDANLSYLWSNDETELSTKDLCAGNYGLKITDKYGCEYINNYNIIEPAELSYEINLQDVECAGFVNGSISIENVNGGVGPYLYSVNGSDYDSESNFDNLSGGIFSIEIKDKNSCIVQDSIEILEPEFIIVDAGKDGFIELGESFQINASVSLTENLLLEWNTQSDLSCYECLDPAVTPSETTTYELIVIDELTGCQEIDELIINVAKPVKIYTPNIFSPNGDGNNDKFLISSNATVIKVNYLKILDRWGDLIFENKNFMTNDLDSSWDGKMNNKDLNPGVYVYVAELELFDGRKEIIKGDITLVR